MLIKKECTVCNFLLKRLIFQGIFWSIWGWGEKRLFIRHGNKNQGCGKKFFSCRIFPNFNKRHHPPHHHVLNFFPVPPPGGPSLKMFLKYFLFVWGGGIINWRWKKILRRLTLGRPCLFSCLNDQGGEGAQKTNIEFYNIENRKREGNGSGNI